MWKGNYKTWKEIETLNKDKIKIQDEFKQIDHIKYAVKTVNDDYGIDLSIEIDKAVKRGEKPSVIAQLKNSKSNRKSRTISSESKRKYTEQERWNPKIGQHKNKSWRNKLFGQINKLMHYFGTSGCVPILGTQI